jgi:Family of unknown function (DUF5684)
MGLGKTLNVICEGDYKMRVSGSVAAWVRACLMVCGAMLLPAVVKAQDSEMPKGLPFALGAGVIGFLLITAFIGYIYHSLALQTIAQKTNTENAWFAWIPIINIILMLNIARKPLWWLLLFFVPLVNIVIAIIVLMGIAEARNKPSWWGILWIIPPISIIVPGYLAWSD